MRRERERLLFTFSITQNHTAAIYLLRLLIQFHNSHSYIASFLLHQTNVINVVIITVVAYLACHATQLEGVEQVYALWPYPVTPKGDVMITLA